MTDVNQNCVNHLRVTFNLKAPVVDAFVQDQPHKDLRFLRTLLDEFGASVSSAGRLIGDSKNEPSALRRLGNAVREKFSSDPALKQRVNGRLTVKLSDDRNVKAFVSSLHLGPFENVLDKKSIRVMTETYSEEEITQVGLKGYVTPPFPPRRIKHELE